MPSDSPAACDASSTPPPGSDHARASPSDSPEPCAPLPPGGRLRRTIGAVLRHRTAQFGLVAGVLFAVAPAAESPSEIALHHVRLEALRAAAAKRSGVVVLPPARAEEIDRRAIEDELLFREGMRLGLDRDDGVVRQRIIQKTLFLAEEIAGASRPATEAELLAHFEAHPEDFALPPRVLVQHVFASTLDALPPRPTDDMGSPGAPIVLGEPGPVPLEITGDQRALAEAFGAEMASRIEALPAGSWQGPLQSPFGHHHVKVLRREPGRPVRFEDVRARVAERESLDRRRRAIADFLARAAARYSVSLDGEPVRVFTASGRVAMRSAVSGED